jgi:exonuclease VII large subunit
MTDFDNTIDDTADHTVDGITDAAKSVSELINAINVVLHREFRDVWVYGEVGKVSQPSSGHVYFDLVEDNDGDRQVLSIKLWRGVRQRLTPKMQQHDMNIVSGNQGSHSRNPRRVRSHWAVRFQDVGYRPSVHPRRSCRST